MDFIWRMFVDEGFRSTLSHAHSWRRLVGQSWVDLDLTCHCCSGAESVPD